MSPDSNRPTSQVDPDWGRRIRDVGENYIQHCAEAADKNMGLARNVYFDLIKVMLALSFAALPLLVTTLPHSESEGIWSLIPLGAAVILFLLSVVLGLIALGTAAYAYREGANEIDDERRSFMKKIHDANYDVMLPIFQAGAKRI
ncbi:MAG: hypothetical protein HYY58_04975 [Candidatus Omnitrophica bacterium]|nr:hypothetical protein [Candidatus Omnitrophota bacterium]